MKISDPMARQRAKGVGLDLREREAFEHQLVGKITAPLLQHRLTMALLQPDLP
jgi:hypothetical protein